MLKLQYMIAAILGLAVAEAFNAPTILRSPTNTHLLKTLSISSAKLRTSTQRTAPILGLRMQLNVLNLEGHFKPGEGFKPHMFKIDGDYELTVNSEGFAEGEVQLNSPAATCEDFVAGFTNDSDPGWSVEPSDGCLDCKGGETEILKVSYRGDKQSNQYGTLVVVLPAENHSWTFKFKAAPYGQ